ncbi:hypothetical protein ACHAXT_011553 [Thalassiosira profunda]
MAAATAPRPYSRYDDGLSSDEEERLLSAQYGEASDDSPGAKRKRSTSATAKLATLTEEDAQAAAEFEEKVTRKKARPALTAAELKGDKGLVFVRRAFPANVRKFREVPFANKARGAGAKSHELARKINAQGQIKAAADYSRSLMGQYRAFANGLFPSLAAEDVFLKIEDLGSKKEVKDYLQVMRDEMRREYLEGIYGAERAGRILNELEHGLRVHPAVDKGYDGVYDDFGKGAVMSRMGYQANDDDEEEEMGGGGEGEETPPASPPAAVANPYAKKDEEAAEATGPEGVEKDGAPANDGDVAMADANNKKEAEAKEDDDEEEEATFSDGEESGEGGPEKGADAAPADEAPADVAETKEAEAAPADKADEDDEEGATLSVSGDDVEAAKANAEEPAEIESNDTPATVEKETEVEEAEPETKDDEVEAAATEPTSMEGVAEAIAEEEVDGEKANEAPVEEAAPEKTAAVDDENVNTKASVQFADDAKTQESLTLVATQFMAADDRFSQVDGGETTTQGLVESPTQLGDDGYTQDVRTQDERFSQADGEAGQEETRGEGQDEEKEEEDEEENTADERFSQFTQGAALAEPVFEEEDGEGEAEGSNNDRLGQTMDTQLSLEY